MTAPQSATANFLGFPPEWWDAKMLWSLGAAAIAAFAVLVFTTGSVVSNKRAAEAARTALAHFQSDTLRRVSEANVEAAKANAKAELERLERLKIEERLAPRSLSATDRLQIEEAIIGSPSLAVDIFVSDQSSDGSGIAADLAQVLTLSSWDMKSWSWTGFSGIKGIVVFTKNGSSQVIAHAANNLVSALQAVGLTSHAAVWPTEWARFGGMLTGPTFLAERTEIRIVVGSK